jgi:hypothetical protein
VDALPAVLLFVGIGGLVVWGMVWAHKVEKQRQAALSAWCSSLSGTFSPARDSSFEDRYPAFSCLRQGSARYAYNCVEVDRESRPFYAFDYHYETHSTDSKGRRQTHHHYFSALVLHSGLPLKPLFLRPEGFFDKVTELFGADDIDFESTRFSREFYVKSPDRKWAFDVIHQGTMEFLLESPRFTVESEGPHVMVRKNGKLKAEEFASALAVADGILDRLPKYLLQDLQAGRRGGA